jgi:hypothetical protein
MDIYSQAVGKFHTAKHFYLLYFFTIMRPIAG